VLTSGRGEEDGGGEPTAPGQPERGTRGCQADSSARTRPPCSAPISSPSGPSRPAPPGRHQAVKRSDGTGPNRTRQAQSSRSAARQAADPLLGRARWQNEFFYLDGEVTLTNNERGADYNITATPVTWDEVTADITTPAAKGAVRYGLVRDTGDDAAPVPQYLTRSTPADPAQVPQHSAVS
jgi:hypothetical protein